MASDSVPCSSPEMASVPSTAVEQVAGIHGGASPELVGFARFDRVVVLLQRGGKRFGRISDLFGKLFDGVGLEHDAGIDEFWLVVQPRFMMTGQAI